MKLNALILSLSTAGGPLLVAADTIEPRTPFDRAPWVSARAGAMGEGLSPIANGLDAAYYNPALIGGLYLKKETPAIRQLYFPYVGTSLNASSLALQKEMQAGKNISDEAVAAELLNAFKDQHPYARLSLVPAAIFNHVLLSFAYDARAQASPNPDIPSEIIIDYRTQTGPVMGFSVRSPDRTVSLGITAAMLNITAVHGSLSLPTANDGVARNKAFSDMEHSYTAMPLHVGMQWSYETFYRSALSIVDRNMGGTHYKAKESDAPELIDPEDFAIAYSLSPNIGKWGMISTVIEANQLTYEPVPIGKKFRIGTELTIGNRFGAEAGLALRLSYGAAGINFGTGFNLGILGFQFASMAEDIGLNGKTVIERKSMINIGINVADY